MQQLHVRCDFKRIGLVYQMTGDALEDRSLSLPNSVIEVALVSIDRK